MCALGGREFRREAKLLERKPRNGGEHGPQVSGLQELARGTVEGWNVADPLGLGPSFGRRRTYSYPDSVVLSHPSSDFRKCRRIDTGSIVGVGHAKHARENRG